MGHRKPRLIDGVVLGWVAGMDAGRGLLVDFPGSSGRAVAARTVLSLDAATIEAAVKERRGAVLQFEDGDPRRPVLMGLLQATAQTPMLDALLAAPAPAPEKKERLSARVEGKRVVLEGKDEIVLRCGDSTIILRRNGAVLVRGAEIESRSSGRQVIRGRKVALN
ncbi:MAG TPA: DUF6484 domain-containing protein [Myxococcaceae bacterium]|nr:DUF6484 domain-containing protein [Myxococcaceae bacterium]